MGFRDGFGSGLGVGIGYKLAEYVMELGGILIFIVVVLLCGFCNSDGSSRSRTTGPAPNAPANAAKVITNASNSFANAAKTTANRATLASENRSYLANSSPTNAKTAPVTNVGPSANSSSGTTISNVAANASER